MITPRRTRWSGPLMSPPDVLMISKCLITIRSSRTVSRFQRRRGIREMRSSMRLMYSLYGRYNQWRKELKSDEPGTTATGPCAVRCGTAGCHTKDELCDPLVPKQKAIPRSLREIPAPMQRRQVPNRSETVLADDVTWAILPFPSSMETMRDETGWSPESITWWWPVAAKDLGRDDIASLVEWLHWRWWHWYRVLPGTPSLLSDDKYPYDVLYAQESNLSEEQSRADCGNVRWGQPYAALSMITEAERRWNPSRYAAFQSLSDWFIKRALCQDRDGHDVTGCHETM